MFSKVTIMTFKYQEWKTEESEQRIINSLSGGDKTFGELLRLTDLSKPVLSKRLKGLQKKGKIDLVPDKKTKRFLYSLIEESLDDKERMRLNLSIITNFLIDGLEQKAKDPSVSDNEYLDWLKKTMAILWDLRVLGYVYFMSLPQEKEWWRLTFGSEFANRMPSIFRKDRLERFKNIIEKDSAIPLFGKTSPQDIEKYIGSKLKEATKNRD